MGGGGGGGMPCPLRRINYFALKKTHPTEKLTLLTPPLIWTTLINNAFLDHECFQYKKFSINLRNLTTNHFLLSDRGIAGHIPFHHLI